MKAAKITGRWRVSRSRQTWGWRNGWFEMFRRDDGRYMVNCFGSRLRGFNVFVAVVDDFGTLVRVA